MDVYQVLHKYSAESRCWVTVFSTAEHTVQYEHGPDSKSFNDCCLAFKGIYTIEEFIDRCFHLEQQTAGSTALDGERICAKDFSQTGGSPVHLDQITLK